MLESSFTPGHVLEFRAKRVLRWPAIRTFQLNRHEYLPRTFPSSFWHSDDPLTYLLSVSLGSLMVHTGNPFALARRDRLVSRAQSSVILTELRKGHAFRSALLDFAANLGLGGFTSTLAGRWAPAPYPIAAYRGCVGGIVSVDRQHQSRLRKWHGAVYYLLVILLQLVPYSLAGGAGVNIGLACSRPAAWYRGNRWWGVPVEAIRDAARIHILAVPLLLVASTVEFLGA